MGEGGRALALIRLVAAGPVVADRAGEVALGLAMTVALVLRCATSAPTLGSGGAYAPQACTAATLEVWITRGTPSAAAASTTSRGVSAFILHSRSSGRDPT